MSAGYTSVGKQLIPLLASAAGKEEQVRLNSNRLLDHTHTCPRPRPHYRRPANQETSTPPSFPPTHHKQIVALAMPNTLAFPLGFLGAAWAGAATAPLNPDYKQEEFAFYLEAR